MPYLAEDERFGKLPLYLAAQLPPHFVRYFVRNVKPQAVEPHPQIFERNIDQIAPHFGIVGVPLRHIFAIRKMRVVSLLGIRKIPVYQKPIVILGIPTLF